MAVIKTIVEVIERDKAHLGSRARGADYGNFLCRNGASRKGPSPDIIGLVYGITVNGLKEDYSNNSYILYKSLK
jgi:hypothetical protein